MKWKFEALNNEQEYSRYSYRVCLNIERIQSFQNIISVNIWIFNKKIEHDRLLLPDR